MKQSIDDFMEVVASNKENRIGHSGCS